MPKAPCLFVFLSLVVFKTTYGRALFNGGSISFSIRNDSGKMFDWSAKSMISYNANEPYFTQADLDILTGWVLQSGPCGRSCSETDIGQITNNRRSEIERAAGDSIYFGNWTAEYKIHDQTYVKELTNILNSNMKEIVIRIDSEAKWEQELMKVSVELEKDMDTNQYEDIAIKLNQINKIHIAVVDPENDLVQCRKADFSETTVYLATHPTPGVRIFENCTVIIDANQTQYGNYDGKQYSVAMSVRDFNRHDIHLGTVTYPKYKFSLSAVPVQFVIQVLAHFDGPIFVKPPVDSNHHTILYTGVVWRQLVYAKAVENRTVAKFIAYGREQEHLNVTAIQDGSSPRVRYVEISWSPLGIDTEHHIFCITAVDNTGVTSDEDMCFTIETRPTLFTDRPQFFNVPAQGQLVECALDVTCVLPLYIKSAAGMKEVLVSSTSFGETETGYITVANIYGESVYQSDLSFRSSSAGHHEVCVVAVDIKGEQSARTCIQAKLDPPDPCMSTPCKNSGTCARSQGDPNDYTCHCVQHFSGKQCENRDLVCPHNPCAHGVCYDIMPHDYYCDCSSTGYDGKNCSIPSSSCQHDGCVHGMCQSFVLSSHCVCDPGYEGRRCETKSP